MKVICAQPTIASKPSKDRVYRFDLSICKRPIVLVLIASLISLLVMAGTLFSVLKKTPGFRNPVKVWAGSYGYKSLTEKQPFIDLLKIPYYILKPIDIPQFVVDIKFKDFQKLQKKRQQALIKGLLVTAKDDFVPAKIRFEGLTTKVKVRLKGDQLNHLESDKWSFRVKVKGKNHLFGMRVFSVQNPSARGFQGAPLFYSTLRHYGVLAPRYHLVDLIVNGSNLGIMSVEEHFSKEMLENNGRKESVIIKFDEDLVWDARDGQWNTGVGGHFDNYHLAQIDSFGTKKILKSKTLSKNYEIAVGLLRGFESGKMAPSDVFDAKLMGRFIAVSELWGSWHSFSWRNTRYYFNPITARLEPIGNDPDVQHPSRPGVNRAIEEPVTSIMRKALLDDPQIFAEFKKSVQLISDEMDNGSLMEYLEQVQSKYLPTLKKEFFLLQPFDQTLLQQRIALLTKYSKSDMDKIYQIKKSYPLLLQAYQIKDSNESYVELTNITPSAVEVVAIKWVHNKDHNKGNFGVSTNNVSFPIELPPTPLLENPSYIKINFDNDAKYQKDYHIEITAKIKFSQDLVFIAAEPYYKALTNNPIPTPSLQVQISKHQNYMVVDSTNKTMTVKSGDWKVYESIIVPKHYKLVVEAGTTLQFASDASIISNGSVLFSGDENHNIRLEGINNDSWQGMVVMNSPEPSILTNVKITATKGIDIPGWSLTGGTTFFNSEVTINGSIFEDSRGEDALNIVHSKFLLNNVTITNTASDGFDADFSTGVVKGGLYKDIGLAGGGDAIDISGSNISVDNTHFINIDDKAISVGERSQMIASGLNINKTGTGAASKDGSTLELKNTTIQNARVAGLMAYIKKPEFGPGQIKATEIDFSNNFVKARVQKESSIYIDNVEVQTVDIDVKDMYKTVMKKGLH